MVVEGVVEVRLRRKVLQRNSKAGRVIPLGSGGKVCWGNGREFRVECLPGANCKARPQAWGLQVEVIGSGEW